MTIKTVTIASGQTESSVLNMNEDVRIGRGRLFTLYFDDFTGTSITFQISPDNATFYPYYDEDGTQITKTVGSDRAVNLNATQFASIQYLKIVSDSAEGAERTITCVTREI